MFKLFTLEEATNMIPFVDRTLRDMQAAIKDIITLREALQGVNAQSMKARNMIEEVNFLVRLVHEHKAELDRSGAHIKDVEAGLVDFPSQLGAEVVYLCWEQGQDDITHYHRLDQEETARRPLPEQPQPQQPSA